MNQLHQNHICMKKECQKIDGVCPKSSALSGKSVSLYKIIKCLFSSYPTCFLCWESLQVCAHSI